MSRSFHQGSRKGRGAAASASSSVAAAAAPLPDVDVVIDGSQGEGGGQILRTSLSLAVIIGKAVRIHRIRAGRPKPGLARQHLVAVEAAVTLGGGVLMGGAIGSCEIVYVPPPATQTLNASYVFDIGSAGSTSLVLQTILPIIMHRCAAAPATECAVELRGGTHNAMSPPITFLQRCFLPQIARMGWGVDLTLDRHGFYPAGGGVVRVHARALPPPSSPFACIARGALRERSAVALGARLPADTLEIQAAELRRALGWRAREVEAQAVESAGRGNVLYAAQATDTSCEMATAFLDDGGADVRAACAALADDMSRFATSTACVGEHLADQLLLPLVLTVGGEFTATTVSEHFRTNVEIIHTFCGPCIEYVHDAEKDVWTVRVRPPALPAVLSGAATAAVASSVATGAVHADST